MLNSFRKLPSQNLGRPIRSFLFFILFYLYLWLEVNPRLIYHGGETITNFPGFFRGWSFFQQFLSYPGGLIEYLSAFLFQFFYIGWTGALVVTLQACLICACTDYFLKAVNAPRLRWVRFVPPILLLIIYTRYSYHFTTAMALLAALLFVFLYLRVGLKSKLFRTVVFMILSVILYYIAAGAYLLFAALCAVYELLFNRNWRIGLLCLLSAAIIPYIEGALIFGTSIVDAFSELLPFSHKILNYETRRRMVTIVYILYILLPLTALGLGLWQIFVGSLTPSPNHPNKSGANSNEADKKVERKPTAAIFSWYTRMPLLRWIVESCLLLVIAGTVVFSSHDNKLKTLLEADYYACHRMWPQVLAAFRRYPNSLFIVHAVNRALYYTGQLSSNMFSYPQHPDTLFLTSKQHVSAFWKKADVFIDLGVMNMAESALIESMIRLKERPQILKRLAFISMVKADSGAARVYLGALSKTLFHADWANDYINSLESDPSLSTNDLIQHLRDMMMETDYGFTNYP
jgi:hypothetical protein